ncbi:MAG TPA: tetratricopeptide repeat protein [Stellaceae bacterium]|nr:tetratricopeptide repeat protein [Stellaceae bacterium]
MRVMTVAAGAALMVLCSLSATKAQVAAQYFPPDLGDPTALACDTLAGPPNDPQRVGSGKEIEEIDTAQALPACQAAAQRVPARPRYQYLYGRVLIAAGHDAEAAQQFAAANGGGSAAGAAALGSLYANGAGVAADPAKAAALFQRAGDGGDPDGYALLGLLLVDGNPPNYIEAASWFERAARAGSLAGETYLGELYANGAGVPRDPQKAVSLFQQAASRDPEAMADLGIAYFAGVGVERDPAVAARWLYRPAQLGYVQAQDLLGYQYETGDGVAQNADYAIGWYRQSAAQGSPFGMTHLAEQLSAENQGADGVPFLRKAAESGYTAAEADLAIDYDSGVDGVPRDARQAAFWYAKAARQGNAFAAVRLGEHFEHGDGVDRDLAKARELYQRIAGQYPDRTGDAARLDLARLDRASALETQAASSAPVPASPPPRRPLPSGPQSASDERTEDVLILGAIVIGAAWLLSAQAPGRPIPAARRSHRFSRSTLPKVPRSPAPRAGPKVPPAAGDAAPGSAALILP